VRKGQTTLPWDADVVRKASSMGVCHLIAPGYCGEGMTTPGGFGLGETKSAVAAGGDDEVACRGLMGRSSGSGDCFPEVALEFFGISIRRRFRADGRRPGVAVEAERCVDGTVVRGDIPRGGFGVGDGRAPKLRGRPGNADARRRRGLGLGLWLSSSMAARPRRGRRG